MRLHATLNLVNSAATRNEDSPLAGMELFGTVMTLFGVASQDFELGEFLPAQVIISVLQPLGFNEPAIRATLRRNTQRGMLIASAQGRQTRYSLSKNGRSLVAQGRARVHDANALVHSTNEWTLLTFPDGASVRNDRYHLNLRLAWAGFGRLMPGVWITPGQADVTALFDDAFAGNKPVDALGFTAVPLRSEDVPGLIARAWDLHKIRAEHEHFIAKWNRRATTNENASSELVHLLNDWSTLLLADPGLPESGVPHDWPAKKSMAVLNEKKAALWLPALVSLRNLLSHI